jgi:hypothetical protein
MTLSAERLPFCTAITFSWYLDTYNYVLDVGLAVVKVFDDFLEVLEHEVLVGKQLLVVVQGTNLVLSDILTLLKDSHSIVVVLSEEEDIESRLFEVHHSE